MDKEKIIMVLLIITILLSVGSIIFTLATNTDGRLNIVEPTRADPDDTGSVQLIVEEPVVGAG